MILSLIRLTYRPIKPLADAIKQAFHKADLSADPLKRARVVETVDEVGQALSYLDGEPDAGASKALMLEILHGAANVLVEAGGCLAELMLAGPYADYRELVEGVDYCSGEPLESWEVGLAGFSLASSVVGWDRVVKVLKVFGKVAVKIWKSAKAILRMKKSELVADSAASLGMSKVDDIKAWGRASADVSPSRLDNIVSESKRVLPSPNIQDIDPDAIKFSQSSVNGTAERVAQMQKTGWEGLDPVQVVKTSDGTLVAVDGNTRVLAASRLGTKAKSVVYAPDEILSPDLAKRFTTPKDGTPKTWGEALQFRINKQKKLYREQYPNGSYVTKSDD